MSSSSLGSRRRWLCQPKGGAESNSCSEAFQGPLQCRASLVRLQGSVYMLACGVAALGAISCPGRAWVDLRTTGLARATEGAPSVAGRKVDAPGGATTGGCTGSRMVHWGQPVPCDLPVSTTWVVQVLHILGVRQLAGLAS